MANPMDYFNPASVRGLYSKIQERERQKMLNDILARNVEQGQAVPFIDEQAQFMGQESPAGLVESRGPDQFNLQNALTDMYKSGLGTEALALQQGMLRGDNTPANIQEWRIFSSLPEKDQERYLRMKRAGKIIDTGSQFLSAGMLDPTETSFIAEKQLKPSERPEYIQKKEQAEKTGAAKGQAQVDMPGKEMDFERNISLIDEIKNHPGKSIAVGATAIIPGIPGTQQKDFITALDQLRNTVFIENRQLLKGGGAITDFEGKKAEAAAARLDRAQTPQAFDKALDDYKYWTQKGMEKLRAQAGATIQNSPSPSQTATIGTPKVGTMKGGYVFIGGNPADPKSWKPAK